MCDSSHRCCSATQCLAQDGRLQIADWGHLPLPILEGVKHAVEGTDCSGSRTTALLKSARLVNKHWGKWATGSVTFLDIKGVFIRDVLAVPLVKIAGTIKRKFVAVEGLDLSRYNASFYERYTDCEVEAIDQEELDYRTKSIDLGALEELHQLTHLDISQRLIDDEDLERISNLTALTHLTVCGHEYLQCSIGLATELGLAHVGNLVGLRHLVLNHLFLDLDGKEMRHLTGLTCLEHLEMRALPYVTDVCVEWLAKVTTLVHLELSPLHSGDLFHLGHDYQLTDQGLKHVAQLQALKYLCLEKCGMVSNKGLKYIGKLTGLEYLDISRMSSITSAGLDHLSELRSLRCLVLSGCCNLFHGARDVLVGMGLGSIRLVLDRW